MAKNRLLISILLFSILWTTCNKDNYQDAVSPTDDSRIEKSIYLGGENNTEFVLYKVIGGGPTKPGMMQRYIPPLVPIVFGNQNGDIEMVKEVWTFFQNKAK